MGKLTFKGGIHPYEGKELAKNHPIEKYLPKGDMAYLMSQHIGAPSVPCVKKGDQVLAGQKIADAGGFVSVPLHASVSGTVKGIEKRLNATGAMIDAIIVENDQQYQEVEFTPAKLEDLTKEEILNRIKEGGVVGMGGAGFPTHVKLAPKNPNDIRFVIANGAECEPYICCDDQLMRNYADEIVGGLKIMLTLFPNAEGVILIEENKPEAIAAMEKACSGESNIRVHRVVPKYPQGGERAIMDVVAGKHIKLGMLPADVGCVVDNVATVRAIYRAVCKSEPLMERGFTVSGDAVKNPCNLIVKIGTGLEEMLEAAGGFKDGVEPEKLLCGGPMMGFAMSDLDAVVNKNNNALTILAKDPVAQAEEQQTACIRCGRCAHVCPLGLTPQMMAAAAEKKDYDRYENKLYGLECIACGSCTFVCPAKRPLMQLFKQTKSEIMAAKRKK